MKNFMKHIALAVVLACSVSFAQAQSLFGHAGLEFALPMGDWAKDVYTIGMGGSGGIELGLSDKLAITADAGVIFFALDDKVSDFIKNTRAIPIQAGIRYYLNQQRSGLFLEGKVGVHMFSTTTEDFDFGGFTVEGETTNDTFLSFAPQVGMFLGENLSLALRYQIFLISEDKDTGRESDTGSFLGLKLAYNF